MRIGLSARECCTWMCYGGRGAECHHRGVDDCVMVREVGGRTARQDFFGGIGLCGGFFGGEVLGYHERCFSGEEVILHRPRRQRVKFDVWTGKQGR